MRPAPITACIAGIGATSINYLASSRRYRLNGGPSDDVKQALRKLEL